MNTPFEKRICFTVCICQMTAVLSCVSIVYLTVAIYKPAYMTLSSGFLEEPVMCTTISNETSPNCDEPHGPNPEKWKAWNSCSEWCLSKSGGGCPRIMVDVRYNGSGIRLEGCDYIDSILCSGIDPDKPPLECVKGHCQGMSGLFNCTTPIQTPGSGSDQSYGAKCRELTSILTCIITDVDDESSCETQKGCLNLNGTYQCRVGKCQRLKAPYNCQKRCVGIKTGNKTVIIREGDKIFSAQCQRAINESTGDEIWPLNYKSVSDPEVPKTLLMFCTNMFVANNDNSSYILSDCFNGTLLEPNYFGNTTDIIQLTQSHVDFMDRGVEAYGVGLVGPPERDLLIVNNTRLFINFESCVNTLILNECEKFYTEYGGDGRDLRSQSRYQCFYSPDDFDFVALRFSRRRTMTELLLATTIPITLAIVSCMTLVICSRIIHHKMVGALGVVASAVGTSRQRRDSRNSQHEEPPTRRPTISEILASRHVMAVGGGGGGSGYRDRGGTVDPLLFPRAPPEPEKMTVKEQIKFYVSLTLGILASLCVFALLFLIPLVVEPSISTLLADFDPEPATCVTIDSNLVTGLTKCGTFSSCREGCTSTPSQCYQIYVSYRKSNRLPHIKNNTILPTSEWMDESRWDESYTQLLINVKGCGYPPRVKCEEFGIAFGQEGRTFNCYYSRSNPRLVVTDYNWEETAFPLVLALGLPTILFAISIAILSAWYCPSCEERGKNKRPCRSRYSVPRPKASDLLDEPTGQRRRPNNNNQSERNKANSAEPNHQPEPVAHQPLRRKHSLYNPNSPSLATISSGDTTVSSINSLDGWQSPPSPPPRFNSRMNASSKSNLSTRTRKL